MADVMKKVRWRMSIGLVGCRREGEIEVEDDATDEEIGELVWEEATQLIETTWEQVDG